MMEIKPDLKWRRRMHSLITPEKQEGKIIGKVGLTIEKANHMGVTFEVKVDEGHRKIHQLNME